MRFSSLERGPAWALASAAIIASLSLVAVAVREYTTDWRRIQRRHERERGIPHRGVIEVAPFGTPERCITCHVSFEGGERQSSPPLASSRLMPHPTLFQVHPPDRDGCVACHGGSGRSLSIRGAHPSSGPEELRRGILIQAGCVRCHTPGSVEGGRAVVDGLFLFLDLGCLACHRAGGLRAESEFGPDLTRVGLRGSEYVRLVVRDPGRLFPGTKMPGFAPALEEKSREEALLAYLLTLRGDPLRRKGINQAWIPCVTCHTGGTVGSPPHKCVYIKERGRELACGRCHRPSPPRSLRPCPTIEGHRFVCGACHEGSER